MGVQEIYRKTYSDVAFEGVGGNLELYTLDKSGIKILLHNCKITEKNIANYKTLNHLNTDFFKNNQHYVLGKALIGEVVASEKLLISNVNNDFRFDQHGMDVDVNKFTLKVGGTSATFGSMLEVTDNIIQIKAANVDITGAVTFNSFNDDLQGCFSYNNGRTQINGGRIVTGSIEAGSIDTTNLYLSGRNIYDVINNAVINISHNDGTSTYIGGSGTYKTVNGANYGYKSMISIATGKIYGEAFSDQWIQLDDYMKGKKFDAHLVLQGFAFNNTPYAVTVTIDTANVDYVNARVPVKNVLGDPTNWVQFSIIAIA
ncbi:MAG: hypothetical protein Q8936_01375 [Bacillota bacterium]|nr:hypothetical protein [Bacillota bacterium]